MKRKGLPKSVLLVVFGTVLSVALIAYLSMPYAPRTRGEVCGHYVLDCELVHEELTLSGDGTFTQTVTIKPTGELISSKGRWEYKTDTSDILFGSVMFYSGPDEGLLSPLEWPNQLKPRHAYRTPSGAALPAVKWFGRVTLGGSVDSWPDWKKVTSP